MALVQIAHFDDLTEAHVAAGAVRSAGIPVFLQNEQWGQVEAYMQRAMGGFRLWVPEEEAEAARAFLDEQRAGYVAPVREGGLALSGLTLLVTGLLGAAPAMLLARFRKPLRDI